jgi:hydantoinase/carbamoylase family amidase
MQINANRLWTDLEELGKIGLSPNGGINRIALNESDQIARQWLIDRMTSIGLDVKRDAAMNVIGTLKAKNPTTDKKAASGSHLDTVPNGGRFDGALGVVCALECARTLMDYNIELPCDYEVISFCDEEAGHYAGTIGSRAMRGLLKNGEIYQTKSDSHHSFAKSLENVGGFPEKIYEARRKAEDFLFFLEIHIEQGRILEHKNCDIGAVTGIVGIFHHF